MRALLLALLLSFPAACSEIPAPFDKQDSSALQLLCQDLLSLRDFALTGPCRPRLTC